MPSCGSRTTRLAAVALTSGCGQPVSRGVQNGGGGVRIELTIREYAESDWQAGCPVHDRARPLDFLGHPGFTGRHHIRTLDQAAEEDGFFKSRTAVALSRARVIGFASVDGAYLSFLYVDPDFHRRGVA